MTINIHLLDVEHCVFEIWVLRLQITEGILFGSVPFGKFLEGIATSCNKNRGIPSQFSAFLHGIPIASWETWLAWLHSSLNRGTFCLFLLTPFLDWEDGRFFFLKFQRRKTHFLLHITHDIVKSAAEWYRVSWRKWLAREVVTGMAMSFFCLGWCQSVQTHQNIKPQHFKTRIPQ